MLVSIFTVIPCLAQSTEVGATRANVKPVNFQT